MLYKDPCVFVAGDEYQISFITLVKGIAWVEISGKIYKDSHNGLICSNSLIHKISVPMRDLDAYGCYTVCFRALSERKAYFPVLQELQIAKYSFRPIKEGMPVGICFLADTHSRIKAPCRVAMKISEKTDLLILAGDIPEDCDTLEKIYAVYDLSSEITHGQIPVIYARGNHDMRGEFANEFIKYIGTHNGNTWFTFRLGSLWGIVLDCGEDKNDSNPEYGGLVDCHAMRQHETQWLQSVLAAESTEFNSPGVSKRVAICHQPFTTKHLFAGNSKLFDIESEVYSKWTQLLNAMNIDLMLCGHSHVLATVKPGEKDSAHSTMFPVYIAATPVYTKAQQYWHYSNASYVGSWILIDGGRVIIEAIDDLGNCLKIRE